MTPADGSKKKYREEADRKDKGFGVRALNIEKQYLRRERKHGL